MIAVRRMLSLVLIVLLIAAALPAAAQTPSPEPETAAISLLHQWAIEAEATSTYNTPSAGDDYKPEQATGKPDADNCGDSPFAWASQTPDGEETLTLTFEVAVFPVQVTIYQNSGAGAITQVALIAAKSETLMSLPDSGDPRTGCQLQHSLFFDPIAIPPIIGVQITLDESITGTWNEIDAVELVGIRREDLTKISAAGLTVVNQWAADASATSQYSNPNWSAEQATGKPDVSGCGDNANAWASAAPDGQDELTLTFQEPVLPLELYIHQTYTPGSITQVSLIAAETGELIPVPDSADPDTQCPHIFAPDLSKLEKPPRVNGVVITLDQTIGGGWNEIDAVRLVGLGAN